MSPKAKWEYMKTVRERYQEAKGRKGKGLILTEFSKTYRCHRKHAIRLMNGPEPGKQRPPRRRRGSAYTKGRLGSLLVAIWKASGLLCGQRMKPGMALWMRDIRETLKTTAEEERLLGRIGAATIDRHLKPYRDRMGRRQYGGTKPGRLLKHHIPVKTDNWDVDRPGYTEVDLVSHSGDCAEGDFAYTLDVTDVHTGWVERRCVLGKSQEGVCRALDDIRGSLPFPLLGIDSDNGSEFINSHLWRYCQRKPVVQFTRGRPYKKDDNAHVEQKNWTHVRQPLGYGRYDTKTAVGAIDELYRHELHWFQNLFQPSMKLRGKTRVGARVVRHYDEARTPFDRVLGSGYGIPGKIAELKRMREGLNLFTLSRTVECKLERIWGMRSKAPRPEWLRAGVLPTYWKKRLEGPPMEPETRPALERYERLHDREAARQTWS